MLPAVYPRPRKPIATEQANALPLDKIADKKVIIGLCGRYGSGKSTSTKILRQLYNSVQPVQRVEVPRDVTVLDYIVRILFNLMPINNDPDSVFNLTYKEACNIIKQLLTVHTCKDIAMGRLASTPKAIALPWWEEQSVVHEAALAQPLKLICAQLFDVDYVVLGGWTAETRNLRETMRVNYEVGKEKRTYRNVLEYMGTEVFRQCFDQDFWVKICKRGMTTSKAKLVICEDMRYENELKAIQELDGYAYLIFRDEKELILTEEDKKTHTAQWFHLTFAMNLPRIRNGLTIADLSNTWRMMLWHIVHK